MLSVLKLPCSNSIIYGKKIHNKQVIVCKSVSKSEKLKTIIHNIEKQLPTIKDKLHSYILMNRMEDRHKYMVISDINSELGDIQIMLHKLKMEIDICNFYCSHNHDKI